MRVCMCACANLNRSITDRDVTMCVQSHDQNHSPVLDMTTSENNERGPSSFFA